MIRINNLLRKEMKNMKIYHIKDKYMFNSKNKTGTHRYAVYKDRKTKELRAVQLTHLYEIPGNKRRALNNGHIKKYKLSCYSLPSGIETGYKTKNIYGKAIVLTKYNSRPSYNLTKKDSKRIKAIAKKKIN